MAEQEQPAVAAPMSDGAVEVRTGKTWPEWIEALDAAGAATMTHQAIVAILAEHGLAPWWQQMVSVGYERARGLRETFGQ